MGLIEPATRKGGLGCQRSLHTPLSLVMPPIAGIVRLGGDWALLNSPLKEEKAHLQ